MVPFQIKAQIDWAELWIACLLHSKRKEWETIRRCNNHDCHDLAKQLSQYLLLFSFSFLFLFSLFLFFSFTKDQTCGIVGWIGVHGTWQIEINSKRYISSVQELNKDSIKFFLSTWTWSRFKSPWLRPYNFIMLPFVFCPH